MHVGRQAGLEGAADAAQLDAAGSSSRIAEPHVLPAPHRPLSCALLPRHAPQQHEAACDAAVAHL